VLNFSVLGALQICAGDEAVEICGDLERVLVQTLLVSEGRPIPAETLAEEMWGDHAPDNQANALQAHVSRVRRRLRALEPERRQQRLVLRPSGYWLTVESGELDAVRFTEGVKAAAATMAEGPEAASKLLREVLALWRGEVFGALPAGPICQLAAARYEEIRLRAMELLFDAELALGRHDAILVELTEAHIGNPLRERFCKHLMLALYRAGRQADALEIYRRMWRRLSEELGVQPSRELRGLEHAILSHDTALAPAGDVTGVLRSA
jgi:DNA-binding SARP family transcriptional activator